MMVIADERAVLFITLGLLATTLSCGGDEEIGVSGNACDLSATAPRPDTGTVVVRGTVAPCAFEFREVVTLRDGPGGELPRAPVARGPHGQWVSGTYDPGEVAIWSASGDLVRTIGGGPGEGPGEFMAVRDLIVDTLADEVYIFATAPRVDVYSLEGEYLRYISLPGRGVGGVRLADGTIAATAATVARRSPEPFLIMIRNDSLSREGPEQKFVFAPLLRAADDGVWSAEGPWYEIDHHAPSGGHIDFRVKREAPWYTEPVMNVGGGDVISGRLAGITVDSRRQLIIVKMTGVQDPDAPERSIPQAPSEGEPPPPPRSAEERERDQRMYWDAVVEAFTMDGRLIASERYDYAPDAPWPVNAFNSVTLWYRVNNDESASIQVLELVLAEKSDQESREREPNDGSA